MRFGLIGPANGHEDALERAIRFLSGEAGVHRAVYLGVDGALDRAVRKLAQLLVSDEPDDAALWQRAAERCASASPDSIDAFIVAERARLGLMKFSSLPSAETRLVELLSGKVTVMIWDKASLDEDDIASARLLVFGKSPEPMIKPIGSRWFISPGPLEGHGVAVLEEGESGLDLMLYDDHCREVSRQRLIASAPAKVRVAE